MQKYTTIKLFIQLLFILKINENHNFNQKKKINT